MDNTGTTNGMKLEDLEKLAKPQVTLTGQDGNAFNIIGIVRNGAKKAGWPREAISLLSAEMMRGNYDHVLQTAMRYCDVD